MRRALGASARPIDLLSGHNHFFLLLLEIVKLFLEEVLDFVDKDIGT